MGRRIIRVGIIDWHTDRSYQTRFMYLMYWASEIGLILSMEGANQEFIDSHVG